MISKKELEDGLFNLLYEHVPLETIQETYDAVADVLEIDEE